LSNTDLSERRRAYFSELGEACETHRKRASEYDERAIQFASKALQALTYLNGGGLLAIPAVVALFKSDPLSARHQIILTAASFVVGLVCIVAAQVCAFFTFARRMEAEHWFEQQKTTQLGADYFASVPDEYSKSVRDAQAHGVAGQRKQARSDQWRCGALVCFWLSLFCFILGCWFGVRAVGGL
jgi:hypothetical protein